MSSGELASFMRCSRNCFTLSRVMISAGTRCLILKPVMSCRSCRISPISLKISRDWLASTPDCAMAPAARRAARASAFMGAATLSHLLEYGPLHPENAGGGDSQQSAGKYGDASAIGVRQRPGGQAAEGAQAHHRHSVEGHGAAAEFIGNQGLDQSIGRGHLAHHTVSDQRHHRERVVEN